MPLGVRDVLLVIRAKDQASRAIGDVGRSFGNLGRKQQAILRDSQRNMMQFNRQAADMKLRVSEATRAQINDINTRLRQNSSISAQLATRNARLRQDYMFTTGAAKRAILDEMLSNEVRRKEIAEVNSAYQRQALAIRQASDQTLRKELGNIRTLKEAEMDLRRSRLAEIQERQDRGISRMQRGQAIGGLGVGMTAGGVGTLAVFANAAKHAMTYRDEAAKTLTQVDARVGASVEKLEKLGVRVARNVPIPFKQMQETLYEIFSSMEIDNLPQAERLLTAVSKAAVAGATDVKTAGDATISILNGFKIPISDVNRVLDVQFRTVKEGRITYEEFARTIGRAIPSAAAAGQTIEDLGGMMAFLTRNGLSAAMAATSSARAFDLLKNPKFLNSMKAIGLSVADAEGNFRPMVDVMGDLKKALTELPTAEAKAKMNEFIGAAASPKALKALEDMGIQIKNVADPKIAGTLKNNSARMSDLSLKAAQLRVAQGRAGTKEEKARIADQIRQIQLQKAQIANTNSHMRANAGVASSMRPVADIMADLEEKLKGVSEAERAEIMTALTKGSGGTIQAMRFINLALTDQHNLLGSITADVANSGGAFKAAYKIMRDTPGAKITDLKNRWETFRQEIGVHVIPIALKLIEKLSGVAKWLGELDEGTKKNIVKWGLIAGAVFTVLGVLTLLSGMILLISGALTLLGGTAIAMVVVGLGKFVAMGLAAKQMLESTNPLIKTLGLILAGLAARALYTSLAGVVGMVSKLAMNLLGVAANAKGASGALVGMGKSLGGALIVGGGIEVLTNRLAFNKNQAKKAVAGTVKGAKDSKEALAKVREEIARLDKVDNRGVKLGLGPVNIFSSNEARKAADALKEYRRTEKDLIAQVKQDAADLKRDKSVGEGFEASFKSATSIVQAFGTEVDRAKINIKKFYEDQVAATKAWASNLEELAKPEHGINKTFLKELTDAGPGAAALVQATLDAVRNKETEFINNSIAELDRLKAVTTQKVNETLNSITNAKPTLTIDVFPKWREMVDLPGFLGGKHNSAANTAAKNTRKWGWGGPRREHGGLVTAGKTYLVGERRAELFTPHRSGRISPRVPSNRSTGGNTYYKSITVHARTTATQQEIADEVSWKLRYQ